MNGTIIYPDPAHPQAEDWSTYAPDHDLWNTEYQYVDAGLEMLDFIPAVKRFRNWFGELHRANNRSRGPVRFKTPFPRCPTCRASIYRPLQIEGVWSCRECHSPLPPRESL
jgi:hypothetical protein